MTNSSITTINAPRNARLRRAIALSCVLGAASAASVPVSAQTPTQPQNHSTADAFRGADANGDGRLDEQEFKNFGMTNGAEREEPGQGMPATKHQAQAMRNFKQEDVNGDGYISQDELQQSK